MNLSKLIDGLLIDPSSGLPSASRTCLLIEVLVFVPAQAILMCLGLNTNGWEPLVKIIVATAGIYGANSALRVWTHNGRGWKHIKEDKTDVKPVT